DADNAKCTYDPIIITGDVLGCLDSRANNYNSNATVDNESCTYDIIVNPVLPPVVGGGGGGVFGCIDSQARNYNPLATKDDKSCEYSPFFSTTTENITQPSKLWDFRFLQPKEPTKTFDKQMRVWVIGAKDLTILFNYDLAPATLKTIGVTLTDSTDKTKTFSFLMHRNADGTAYEATVSPLLRAGTYPIDIYIINYDNQATKRIKGTLIVSGTGISPIVPIAVATGLAISFLPSLYDLLVILGQIFGYFFGRRKNENPWGTVYDSVTKQPLDPVYLTVAQDGKEISTAITDIDGRFSFFLPAGVYTIKANKTHYRFPSERLLGKTNDELYDHLYFGDQFTTNGEAIINLNIPMDPLDFDWNEFAKTKTNFFEFYNRRHLWFSRIYKLVFGSGLLLSIYAFLMSPSWWNMVVLVLYLGLIAINRFWRNRHKPLQIIDRSTGEPLPFAIIRVFLPDLNQQIKYVVADKLGRFYLLVRPGVYYYTVEEKQPDGSYLKVFQSNSINLPKGILTNDIYVK
ncbi:MAG: carboxypeptidase-like regulatory domain-containing protein, partial [Candidatus Vogelbacteria bacterium]|nr:carboxypeptidase-like regulatory domain-containing protein [Candidatus Vogelbacteria bacterium]